MRVWPIFDEHFDAVDDDENPVLNLAAISREVGSHPVGRWRQTFVLPHWRLAALINGCFQIGSI
jgi:hypothetical protein